MLGRKQTLSNPDQNNLLHQGAAMDHTAPRTTTHHDAESHAQWALSSQTSGNQTEAVVGH